MNRTEEAHLPVVALTHPGRRGKNNEDRYGVFHFRTGGRTPVPVLVAVLADGIGGHRAGEVAAEIAVQTIERKISTSDGLNPPQIIEEAIEAASQAIYARSQAHPEQKGMGSTCALAWISGSRLFIATVGDSRIYLMRGGHIQQLSVDHTWVQEALERGLLRPEEAEGHPNTHVIRRYLGSPTPPQVDFRLRLTEEQGAIQALQNQGLPLVPGDLLLLCSDGLSDLVSAEEMREEFERASSLSEAAEKLIDLANDRGGHDNITLIALQMQPLAAELTAGQPAGTLGEITAQVPVLPVAAPAGASASPVPAAPPRAAARRERRPLFAGCLGAFLGLALTAGLLLGGYFWLRSLEARQPTATPTRELTLQAPGAFPQLDTPTPGPPTATATVTPRPPTHTPTLSGPRPTITSWPTNTPFLVMAAE